MPKRPIIGLIPARGGSKGIPRKNLAPLAGKSLLAWTIEAARESRRLERVLVSTDDAEIAEAARQCGAEVPFTRPANLALDGTASIDVLVHCINWFSDNEGSEPKYLVELQVTSPFRTAEDIDEAVRIADETECDAVVSVSSAPSHPCWTYQLDSKGRLSPYLRSEEGRFQRQVLPNAYAINGAIYLARPEVLVQRRTFFTDQTYPYIMPPERSLDIDSLWDLHLARLLAERPFAKVG